MFKSNTADDVFLLVYMTGILPIIKVESQSALNNFDEYSVIDPGRTAQYYGFTAMQVQSLCNKFKMDFEMMKHAYDGYIIGDEKSMFNPNSVMQAIEKRNYNSHWSKSASYTTIEHYIHIDEANVKPKIEKLLNGEAITIDDGCFRYYLSEIQCCDSVLALLVTLGLLTYDYEKYLAKIPNKEAANILREIYDIQ